MPASDKPTSLRRQESSRANGAKSRGPVTPEGKARSSRNACLANAITISPEDEAAFKEVLAQYEIDFSPRRQAESDVVTQIAWGTLRLHLAWAEEASLLAMQIHLDEPEVDEQWDDLSDHNRRALAVVASLKESNALSLVQRYIRSLSTQIERSIKLLLLMQKQPLPTAPAPAGPTPEPASQNVQNEPIPINEHRESHAPGTEAKVEDQQNEPTPINEHRALKSHPPPRVIRIAA
jgi:hypothetical protein